MPSMPFHFIAFNSFGPKLVVQVFRGVYGQECHQFFTPSPHCGTSEFLETAFLVASSEGHSTFDDKEELEDDALEIPTGNVFELSSVGTDSL